MPNGLLRSGVTAAFDQDLWQALQITPGQAWKIDNTIQPSLLLGLNKGGQGTPGIPAAISAEKQADGSIALIVKLTNADAYWLKLDGSNANTTVDIGTQKLSCTDLTAKGAVLFDSPSSRAEHVKIKAAGFTYFLANTTAPNFSFFAPLSMYTGTITKWATIGEGTWKIAGFDLTLPVLSATSRFGATPIPKQGVLGAKIFAGDPAHVLQGAVQVLSAGVDGSSNHQVSSFIANGLHLDILTNIAGDIRIKPYSGNIELGAGAHNVKVSDHGDLSFVGRAGFYPRRVSQSAEPTNGTDADEIDEGELMVWRDPDDNKNYLMYNDADEGIRKVEFT